MKYNVVPFSPNISRVYEIAKCGGRSMKIKGENEADAYLLANFYGVQQTEDPDMMVQFDPPCADDILQCFEGAKRHETKEDIDARIHAFKEKYDGIVEFDDTLKGGSRALLKTAINKCNFGLKTVVSILSVAKTIALMEGKNEYGVEHVAEAINYKTT